MKSILSRRSIYIDSEHRSIPPDEGCDLAPSCLNCPFPICRHDLSIPELRQLKNSSPEKP